MSSSILSSTGEPSCPPPLNNHHLNVALIWAEQGVPVFPVSPETKAPLVQGGFKSATTDQGTIMQWWTSRSEAMVGIPTGHISGIIVLDIDVKDGANPHERLANFEAITGAAFPRNFVVNTPSGGLHVYMAMPPHTDIRSGARILGQEGVDIRANGGYVVAAGSIRADGRAYALVTEVGHA